MINYWYEFSATNEYHFILRCEFSLPVPKRAASRALNLWWVVGGRSTNQAIETIIIIGYHTL